MKLCNLETSKALQELGYDGEYTKTYNTSGELIDIDPSAITPPPRNSLNGSNIWRDGQTEKSSTPQQSSEISAAHRVSSAKIICEPPQWQKDLAHWANQRQAWWSVDFKDFSPRKGFCCKEYLTQNTNPMNWKNLKTNPPQRACDILCRTDHGGYRETYVAKCAGGEYWRVNRYGIKDGNAIHHGDANDKTQYIIIDEIL